MIGRSFLFFLGTKNKGYPARDLDSRINPFLIFSLRYSFSTLSYSSFIG